MTIQSKNHLKPTFPPGQTAGAGAPLVRSSPFSPSQRLSLRARMPSGLEAEPEAGAGPHQLASNGFTRLGLIGLMLILGISLGAALPYFMENQKKGREGVAWTDIKRLTIAVELYFVDCNAYPIEDAKSGSTSGLKRLISDDVPGWTGPYLTFRRTDAAGNPLDPWGNPYGYQGSATDFTVWCNRTVGGKAYCSRYFGSPRNRTDNFHFP